MATQQQPNFAAVNLQYRLNRERTVTSNVAARMLGLSVRMITYLIRKGQLPAIRNGLRAWRIKSGDIQELQIKREFSIAVKKPYYGTHTIGGRCFASREGK